MVSSFQLPDHFPLQSHSRKKHLPMIHLSFDFAAKRLLVKIFVVLARQMGHSVRLGWSVIWVLAVFRVLFRLCLDLLI